MPRSLLAAVVAALAAMIPAAAWAQAGPTPTLTFDQPCYSPGDEIHFSGTGYTPGGGIEMFFTSLSTQTFGQYDTQADPTGAIAGSLTTPDPDRFLDDTDFSGMMGAAANDRTRIDAGAPQDQQFAGATFTLSRWEVEADQPNGRRARAGKPMRIDAVGFTNARGRMLYVHYTRGVKRLKTIKLGRLSGDCGDRTRILPRALPRGLRPGRYKLIFNTSASNTKQTPRYPITLRLR